MNQEIEIELLKKEVVDLKKEIDTLKTTTLKQNDVQIENTMSIRLLTEQIKQFSDKIEENNEHWNKLSEKLDDMMNKPNRLLDSAKTAIVTTIIGTLVGGIVVYLLTNAFVK